jgi:glycosyltransferase involved in cell wall biosynthesis
MSGPLNLCPEPKVSVVIPALNEEKELGECLASLAGQAFPEFEVIVVDNGSTDKTSSLAEEWGARVVFEGRRGPGYAREAGFRAARAPIIASTDADTVLPPHWVFRIHEAFQEDPEAIAVFGPIRAKPLSAPTSLSQALLPVLETTVVFGQRLAMYARAPLFSGANFAVRREAFFQVPNYLIPSFNLAGEPIRIMLAAQKLRGEEEKILATVVLEKLLFFGIAVVFLLGAAATVMTQNLPPFLHQGLFSLAGAGAVLMSLALTVLWGLPSWTPRGKCLPRVSSFWPGGFQGAVWEIRRSFSRQWSELFKAFLAITFGLALSSLTPFLFFFFAEGKLLPLPTLVSFLGLTTFFSLLWFTPAGLGVAEGGYAATFGLLGLPVGEAVTFALVQRLVALPVIVLGLFYLGRQGIVSWRRGSDG